MVRILSAITCLVLSTAANAANLSVEPFSTEGGTGFKVVQQFSGEPFTRTIFCERDEGYPSVVSDFPEFGILGQEIVVVPGGEPPASSDTDDYEVWHEFWEIRDD